MGIAIVMIATGLLLSFSATSSELEFTRGILLKVGIVLFMMWLAMPQLERMNLWIVASVGMLALVSIVRPQVLLVLPRIIVPLAPVLFLIWLFWMPKKKG